MEMNLDNYAMPATPLATQPPSKSVRVFRSFTFVSFIAIAIAAIVLAMCYRYISIQSITRQSEASNLVVAQAAQQSMHEDVASFLIRLESAPSAAFPATIAAPFYGLVEDTAVRKVKIYNRRGDVIFSTKASEIGRHQPDNVGVLSAMAGKVTSKLIYRDSFNRLDGVTEEDNLIQTYLPVQVEHAGPPVGVFEIYTDVSAMVAQSAEAQIIIALTSVLIMVMLYISLLAIVRRIERVIVVQQDALQDRSDLLAALSTRMLNTQESERQRIAAELHERVAQTLSAVKLGVEGAARTIKNGSDPTPMLEAMVPSLQAATQEVRSIALGLHPPSLDELGLLPTLRWRCRELVEKHPHIDLEMELNVHEDSIPEPLRAIIYRVVDDAYSVLSGNETIGRVMLRLNCDPQRIILLIGDDAQEAGMAFKDSDKPNYLGARERTLLSGGKFSVRPNAWGGLVMQAIWLR